MTALYYNDSINIFTDTSDKKINTSKFGEIKLTCPGFVSTYKSRMIFQGVDIYIDEYTIFGESKAIEMATNWCINFVNSTNYRGYFNIFSDSLSSVAAINNFFIEWMYYLNSGEKNLIQYSINQSESIKRIYYATAYTILRTGLPIRVFYTPGHVPIYDSSFSSFDKYKNKFIKCNKKYHIDLSDDITDRFIYDGATFNNIVDMITRNYLFQFRNYIIEDIETYGSNLEFGNNKILPIRWPFIQENGYIRTNSLDPNQLAQQLMLPLPQIS